LGNKSKTLSPKQPEHKRAGGMVQGVEHLQKLLSSNSSATKIKKPFNMEKCVF
jgi:hypothetical protein